MAPTRRPRVVIIGAGFGGLAMAHELREAGYDDLVVLERAEDVGGVWRDNTYPDAACDVPSSLYSWSWAPKHDWSHRYAKQPEILDYIRTEADRAELRDLVRTRSEVAAAHWSDDDHEWWIRLTDGTDLTADVLISAVGQLSQPAVPPLPGLQDFGGPAFHSAQWDHEVSLTGKRIGVVGTGASAIQFVPSIVDDVAALTVFQRSAPYVVPKPDRSYQRWQQQLFTRAPALHHVARRGVFHLSEQLNKTLDDEGVLVRVLRRVWQAHLRRQVKDTTLRAKLVPDYPLGCKRLLFSNDWYPALTREHVAVETTAIERIEPSGVRTSDGARHECDVLILGTGFAATDFLAPLRVTGRDGLSLGDAWADGARAHLGMTVPGFPNFFCVYGPNTNLGGSSIIGMLEAQATYIRQAIDTMASRRGPVEVRSEVADAFDTEMQQRLAHSVWAGCTSWYQSASGRVTTNWPGPVAEYQDRTARFDPEEYVIGPRPPVTMET